MSPSFSVVLIARNEFKTLPRLIKSLAEFQSRGGEIILVDTGSTDNTASYARSKGCKVFEEGDRFITVIDQKLADDINNKFVVQGEENIVKVGDKLFDYAAARNYAATLSTNDMIAMPDCDEEFTVLNLDIIEQAIADNYSRFEYNFVFSHDEFGKEVIKFMHSKFYNRTKCKWVGIVHEVLMGETTNKFFNEDEIKLEHWQNPSEHRSRYLTGLALDCYQNPTNDRNSHYLAREMLWSNRPKSAIKEFDRHIGMDAWLPERAQSMIFKGDAYCTLGEADNGLQSYHQAILTDGNRREAWLRLANHFWKKDDFTRTACYATAALNIPWNNFYCNYMDHYTWEPHKLLYWAKWYLGDKEESKKHWQKCLEYQPQNPAFLKDWVFYNPTPKVSIVIPTLGREDKLKRLLDLIPQTANYSNLEILIMHDSFDDRQGAPKLVKRGVEKSSGELVMFLGNDCIPQPNFVINAVRAMYTNFGEAMDGLVGLNDGYWNGELATHWLASKKLLPHLDGEFFHTGYYHAGCDNELTERCRMIGKYVWAPDAKVINETQFDKVHAIAYNNGRLKHDRDLLEARSKLIGFELRKNFQRPKNAVN